MNRGIESNAARASSSFDLSFSAGPDTVGDIVDDEGS